MQIVILPAGVGSRLRPHTLEIPKCLVKLANIPILEHQLNVFRNFKIQNKSISIVGGYLSNHLDKYKLRVFKNHKYASTNMVYSLFCALDNIELSEDLIISYGDIVFEKEVLVKLLESNYPVSVVADKSWKKLWELRMENILEDAETFKYDKKFNIIEIGRKPNSINDIKAQYIGLIKIKKEYLDKVKFIYKKNLFDGKYKKSVIENLYMTSFLEMLINFGITTKACLIQGGWLEVDTSSDLEIYNRLYNENKLYKFYKFN